MNASDSVVLTAWAPGYYIGGGRSFLPGDTAIVLALHAHHQSDNPNYSWAGAHAQFGNPNNCQHCHAAAGDANAGLPFDDWVLDAHSGSARNHRFLTMYLGTDVYGNQSPATRYGYSRDYGAFPLSPVYDATWFGPGYRLDFPGTAGNCAACHAPVAAIDDAYGVDPVQLSGVEAEGIGCDFCHKVWDVKINPGTGMPYDNRPGVLSYEFRRPPDGHQFFAGPLDDVAPGEDTCTPVQKESRYCAPCHTAEFWGVTVYNSFGEWLDSPYSDPETGQTCQDCHMPKGLTDHFARLDKGGLIRNPETLSSHRMPGAMDENLLRNAVSLSATGWLENNEAVVEVNITNDKTGHHVPTDSPLRHLILLVIATDAHGDTLRQIQGGMLPDWCGIGDPRQGYYAGISGKAFAKILEELWTGVSPTAAYWKMTRLVSDNRLAAFATDVSQYRFRRPDNGSVRIDVQLFFRRAFRQLADWKGWSDADILMEEEVMNLDQ
ncbi:hypothetical protein A2V82_13355 [candidate division KSB1 bacterium RBG_16_48_16]|nr:MAG: hypothetical protein A2V82_13355 [candidate division KSB1 bacterium RBG_16_48_16]